MKVEELIRHVRVRPGSRVRLKDHDPAWIPSEEFRDLSNEEKKSRARRVLEDNRRRLARAQEVLWASDSRSVLVVLQAMDAAGKDGTIEHVMSGVNPQGCRVLSFKQPSAEELDHSFLWRAMKGAPERGQIMIFNRSHYEDVLVVRVHPELLEAARLPARPRGERLWRERYEDINAFEKHLWRNGTLIVKIFLNVSKAEQKRRFLERLDDPDKRWKFSPGDVRDRARWDDYMRAYEQAMRHTSTPWAPWHVIPADHKWAARAMVSTLLARSIMSLNLRHPTIGKARQRELDAARRLLESE
ncbi:MAG: polyphosphate kinase 2 family protein [Phycisphaerales bacterium]